MDKKTKDKEYPIFSFRIDEEVYGELKEFKKKTGNLGIQFLRNYQKISNLTIHSFVLKLIDQYPVTVYHIDMLKKYPFYLDPKVHKKKLKEEAKRRKVSESSIIRELIEKLN